MANKKLIIAILILGFSIILLLFTLKYSWFIDNYYEMKVEEYTPIKICEYKKVDMCYYDAQIKVDTLFNTWHRLEFVRELEEKTIGESSLVFRKITIKGNLDIQQFVTTYAHELAHIKYQTSNETFVNYISIITLYESGDEQLRQIAMNKAQLIIDGGYTGTEYDCGKQLIDYFKKEMIKSE